MQGTPLILADLCLGIDYIAEYADPKGQYEPGYLCTLCQCRLNPAQAVKHAVSDRHSMEYLVIIHAFVITLEEVKTQEPI